MKNKYVHTKIGQIDITKDIDGYICGENASVTLGEELIIKSCLTKIVGIDKNGEEKEVAPILVESCMRPEIKTIIPVNITIKNFQEEDKYVVKAENRYMEVEFGEDYEKVEARRYKPYNEGHRCKDCYNCGRC